jgi:hypothetical protein
MRRGLIVALFDFKIAAELEVRHQSGRWTGEERMT